MKNKEVDKSFVVLLLGQGVGSLKLEIIKCEYHTKLTCTKTFACFSLC